MPQLISFCEAVQKRSPVGAYIRPIPGMSPGYGDEVIFADGTFVDGSTLELSADGPLREPFVAFTQVHACLLIPSIPLSFLFVFFFAVSSAATFSVYFEANYQSYGRQSRLRRCSLNLINAQGCTHWTHWALVLEEALKRPAFKA